MGCKSCGDKAGVRSATRACTVCTLLDQDTASKQVTYCRLCNAWLCASCDSDILRRAAAAIKNRFGKKT